METIRSGSFREPNTAAPEKGEHVTKDVAGEKMNAEIIAVGTELLHGDILNSNAQYISQKMATIGVDVHYHTVVGDNPSRIRDVFRVAIGRVDLILVTGGLGPTKDDITKEMLAQELGLPMIFCEESVERMEERFRQRGRMMTKNNLRQAYFPEGAEVLMNLNGTADACRLEYEGKIFYLLPGPPNENRPIVDDMILPQLRKNNKQTVVHKKIQVFELGESVSETMLMDLIDAQSNPTIAPYAGQGRLIYRITAKADSQELAEQMIAPVTEEILKRLGKHAKLLEE
ncbi:MAG: CinA family nicotinamide mononucleotide deamidase-related protein [Peptostreptococcaceae bacterium]|nr:CinA family nicotinamide mononucleotide deamidase-related protein [Peptostreptococcaceae bacterium]